MRIIKENDTIDSDEIIQIFRKSPPVAHVYFDFSMNGKSVSCLMNTAVVQVNNNKGLIFYDSSRKSWSADVPFQTISHAILKKGPQNDIVGIILKNNDRVTVEIKGKV